MKNTRIRRMFVTGALALGAASMQAQTVNVPFAVNDAGKKLPIEWGMDTAWDDLYNVNWGIAHYGKNFTTGRISFQPYELVDASKIDDASANFGLPEKMARKLKQRIDRIKLTGTTKVAINCDHEVLTKSLDENGNYGSTEDNKGKGNYVSTSTGFNSTYTTRWKDLIKASVKYAQAQGMEVVSVAPFNEPDYGWNQYYNGTPGTGTTNQQSYGMRDFLAIAKAIKADDFFNTGAGKDVRVCGPNTLNCDRALPWYNYTGMAAAIQECNTHQLSGSFDNYATFFKTVSDAGKVATADELHNVGEAMVGVEYGMQNGIWWAFDAKARGQFMHDSNEGVRLGYAEDRTHWTSAAVYRNDVDKEIHGFIGSSERQANVSTYNFQCTDRDVYFNGYGPQREWSVTTVGGASDSYQNGQINYERLFDITYGEDVQSAPVDGNYQVMNAYDMSLVNNNGNPNDLTCVAQSNTNDQRWHIYPDNVKAKGDCSYWFIDNVGDADLHWNLRDGNLNVGAKVLSYNANHDALEQWYFRYAKDGYFYIITRQSNKYLYNNGGAISVQEGPTSKTGTQELKKYLWRLMPTDAVAEQTAPAIPDAVTANAVGTASAQLSWAAVTGEAKAVTYNVLRQDADGWNTIARCLSSTTFTDNKVEAGKAYNYKVQTVDYSGNRSQASAVVTVVMPESTEVPEFNAGQWEWIGEELDSKDYYLLNKQNKVFLGKNAISSDASVLWTATYNNTVNFKNGSDNIWIQVNNNNGNISSVSVNTTGTAGTNASSDLSVKGDKNGYQFYYTREWTYTQVFWQATAYGTGFISSDGNTISSVNISGNNPTTTNNNTYWLLISFDQYSKYAKVSDYNTVFNTAKGYLTADISSALMNELKGTLDDCDGTINYQNIEGYISRLNAIVEKCRNYNPSGESEDFTGLIINPSIIQTGTTNDAPTGWFGEDTNVTGNGHWTEGTGDTRMEAWNWKTNENALSVDYYQNILLPNGLYKLTAVTHQRANGDANLYGETYRSFSTLMPVGDGNETETAVMDILVTDGNLRIGMRATNDYKDVDNQWVTADDFTLTRLSTPAETDLQHYTAAVEYLNGLAEVEMARNIDHKELLAVRKAANYCTTEATAYEKAINDYIAAIKRSQAMVEAEPVLSTSWVGQTGNYSDCAERYNWGTPYSAGRILYQTIEDLIPGTEYEIQFYAVANVARDLDAGQYAGNGIAYLFANETEQDIEVLYQDGCTPTDYLRTLTAVADENGQITYGIANRKAGGQWYIAQSKSITRIGVPYTASLSVKPGKYGTFVAPFDIELPAGISAYSAEQVGEKVKLTKTLNPGEILEAYTPVILKNTTAAQVAQDYSVNDITLAQSKVVDGPLVGMLIAGDCIPVDNYVLQTKSGTQAFYIVVQDHPFTCAQNRCYLAPAGSLAGPVSCFFFSEDEETGVEGIFVEEDCDDTDCVIYDLTGRRITSAPSSLNSGIYIVNGKKVIVR